MSTYKEELEMVYKQSRGGAFRPTVCPGSNCKLCALIRPILNFRDRYPEEVVNAANDMRAKYQHFSNICFDPDYSTVILFSYGKQIMDDLVKYQCDPITSQDYGDFAHPKRGRIILIEKVIGTNGHPQYSASPRAQIHQMPQTTAPVHNLNQLRELLEQGVEYFPQSKLDVKTTPVRFIGFGPDQSRFFRTVNTHWGISQEDFQSVQQGTYNPFNVGDIGELEEGVVEETVPDDIPDFEPPFHQPPLEEKEPEPATTMPTIPEAESGQPPCWGLEFDPEDSECVDCKTFNASCREAFLKRYGA
jgi:hypothetical protein